MSSELPGLVRIREVGPRDGFQNEPEVVPTEEKVRLIEVLAASGLERLEVTSFVRPDVIPQTVWDLLVPLGCVSGGLLAGVLVGNVNDYFVPLQIDPSDLMVIELQAGVGSGNLAESDGGWSISDGQIPRGEVP